MRKLILSAFFLAASTALFAQKLDDVEESVKKGKYVEAKDKIDKVLADTKNQSSANAWYYKGLVYTELAKDSSKTDMDYRMEAFKAFKRYQELDPKNIMLTLQQNGSFFQLYEGYYNHGIKAFNQKKYDVAFNDFKNALEIKDYVYARKYEVNGFSFPALDTQLTNLAGSAAFLNKQEDVAIGYYQQLANAKLKGDDYKDIYPILVDYYGRKQDSVNKSKYLAIGKEVYPDNPYWLQSELDAVGTDKGKRLARLEELQKANPTNFDLAVDYAVELFNYTYGKEKPADYVKRSENLHAALKNAVTLNPTSAYANFVMTQHLSNQIYDIQEGYNKIKGTKPEDVKKKQAINADINKKYDELFTYASVAHQQYEKLPEMKVGEKANYRIMTNQLIDYYRMKKQADKVKFYEDKLKTLK